MSLDELRFRSAQKWRSQREQWTLWRDGRRSVAWWERWNPENVGSGALRETLRAGRPAQAEEMLPAYFTLRTTPQFFFVEEDRKKLIEVYQREFPGRVEQLRAEAQAICEHCFRIFSYPEFTCGAEIPWRRDQIHGTESDLKHWSRIAYLDFEKVGDSKNVWELNRHQHFFTLGQAYLLTRDEKYAEECLAQFEHWRRENPYLRGINWASSLEVAFRVWSWLWAMHMLSGSNALTGARLAQMTAAVAEHAEFIAANLSTYFSPNTHLLGEGFSLFVTGLLLPELRGADSWRETGHAILSAEMRRQVHADGSHLEQSSYYHRYATDFFLCAAILAERNGSPFPSNHLQSLERMVELILHTTLPSCRHPMTGDADGGRVLAFTPRDPNDHRATLSIAAVFFHRPDFRFGAECFQEEALWLLGGDSATQFARLAPAAPQETSRLFPDAGLAIQRSGWPGKGGRANLLLFDAGQQGMGASGHGHADALQVLCSADGVDWLVDPGTFVYTSSREWREFFRSTRAHNTLVVDGLDQAISVDFFRWREIPKVRLEFSAKLPHLDVTIASHNGYAHLSDPVTHRRSVVFVKPDYWIISDEVCGAGKHKLEFAFHFAPGVELKAMRGDWLASKNNSRLLLVPPADVECRVVSGQEFPKQGWYSGDYGHREPAAVLIATAHINAPARFHWLLWPAPAAWPRLQELPGPGLRLAVETEAWTDRVVLHGQQLHPDASRLWTDAELAFLRREKTGSWRRFVVVNGCCVESDGQPLLSADSMLDELDVVCEGDTLEIHALPVRRMSLHAPQVTRARINGKPATFTRRGEWVEF